MQKKVCDRRRRFGRLFKFRRVGRSDTDRSKEHQQRLSVDSEKKIIANKPSVWPSKRVFTHKFLLIKLKQTKRHITQIKFLN